MPGKFALPEARHHALKLRAVAHGHQRRFDHIVQTVPQRDLVAAAPLRFSVKVAAPHARAEVAGVLAARVLRG